MSEVQKNLGFVSPEKQDIQSYRASLEQRRSLLDSNKSLLDSETYAELQARIDQANKDMNPDNLRAVEQIDSILPQAKEGLGIFGVRRKNEEYAKMIASKPGTARQTVLTSGQNTTGVGSLGLFKQQGR